MKKKLKSRKGFTLVELLIAVALLAIFVSMAVVGTSALFGTGEQMMAVSKAAVLGSDVMKVVTNEIRFGEEFSMNGSAIHYNSTTYGDDCEMILEGGQLKIVQTTTGKDAEGNETTSTKTFSPIGTAAYDEVTILSVTFTVVNKELPDKKGTRQTITCTLSITADGETSLWQKSSTTVPLYQKTY